MANYEIDARFALTANKCAGHDPEGILRKYLKTGDGTNVEEVLRRFPNLMKYQGEIAKQMGLGIFDRKVQERYWLGEGLGTHNKVMEALPDCKVREGKVVEVGSGILRVRIGGKIENVLFDPELVSVKVGSRVKVHQGQVAMIV
jgi:hypothetical protein